MESLLVSDPQRFMKLAMLDNPRERMDGLKTLDDIVLCEILRYGIHNDAGTIPDLKQLYGDRFMQVPTERRGEVFRHVKGMVENVDYVSFNAFLPFIMGDDDRGIVATAVIDYVSLASVSDDGPMGEVREIVGMIEGGMLKNEGAAFGALLHIGDPRVCKLIWPLRDVLDTESITEAINCQTGFISACTADFYIDWLEGMEGDVRDGQFGLVASGLTLLRKRSTVDQVFTGLRPFPFTKTMTKEEIRSLAKPVPFADYQKSIAPRLYALERSEPPPRVMPRVLIEWGLDPLTDPSEMAALDDRHLSPASPIPMIGDAIPEDQIVIIPGDWFDGEGVVFFVWGILNPNGPTLYCLGQKRINGKWRIFFRWLHMLGGRTTYSAKLEPNQPYDIYEEAISIHNYLIESGDQGIMRGIPSFLIVNRWDETFAEIANRLVTEGPLARENWGREIAYLRAFGSNFFGRAGCEIREWYDEAKAKKPAEEETFDMVDWVAARYGHLPEFNSAVSPTFEHSEMTPALLDEWWSTITRVDFSGAALLALSSMWKGASSILSDDMKKGVVPFDAVIDFLARYNVDWAVGLRKSKGEAASGSLEDGLAAAERGDYATAMRLYRPLAEQSDAEAQVSLGLMYAKGQGVSQSDVEAVKWFRLAAAQGHAVGQYSLGLMYDKGQGVSQDFAEALKWYRLAAEQGFAHAQDNIGVMYKNGWGVPQDSAEAAKWFRLGADQGDAVAQHNLGFMYAKGDGVARDYAEAVNWWRRAAEQGYAQAQHNLAIMYESGLGVSQDFVQAHAWLSLAASRFAASEAEKRDKVLEARNSVASKMTPAQIAEAQRLAQEWKPK